MTLPQTSRHPLIPPADVAGWASFQHRHDTPLGRLGMDLLDALVALFGLLLRLGGRPLRWLLSQGLGTLTYWLSPRRRHVSLINLDLVYGDRLSEAEKRRIVLGMFRHYLRAVLDSFYDFIYWPPEKLLASIGREGALPIEAARRLGRGYGFVTSHLGNIDLTARAVAVNGFQCYGIYKGFSNAWFDRHMGRKRLRYGISLIETPATRHDLVNGERVKAPRASLRAEIVELWKQNYGLFFACDQYTRRGGVPMTFMGVPGAPMQVGALKYAVDNKIPLVFGNLVYDARGNPKWHCEGPFPIEEQPGGPDATLLHYLERYNRWLEGEIRQYPEQYAWAHRRFPRHYYQRPRPVRPDQPPADR
jgi:Kdo2-lipid IVA lauroyltransferase/acyltransferase